MLKDLFQLDRGEIDRAGTDQCYSQMQTDLFFFRIKLKDTTEVGNRFSRLPITEVSICQCQIGPDGIGVSQEDILHRAYRFLGLIHSEIKLSELKTQGFIIRVEIDSFQKISGGTLEVILCQQHPTPRIVKIGI